MFDWGDLRYLLAVARHGSTLAAARALGVSRSTVHRHLAALERAIGHPLTDRHPSGYRLTENAKALLPAAEAVAASVAAFERELRMAGGDRDGVIRLTCPQPLASGISESGLLERFHERHPKLRVEFVMSDRDIAKGEADVALRSGEPHDETLVGSKIADSAWAVYASKSYVQHHGRPWRLADLADHALIGFDSVMAGHRAAKWLTEVAPEGRVAARYDSVPGVLSGVKSGVGVAPLPTAMADQQESLVQVLPPVPQLQRGWYLLTHPDLRKAPRIAAFFDFVANNVALVRPILMD